MRPAVRREAGVAPAARGPSKVGAPIGVPCWTQDSAMLDIESLLQPVKADAPGGPNLEYSPAFADLERASKGKAERQMGAVVVAGEEPDWRQVVEKAVALLSTSKDLRVATHLARAMLEVHAFAGLGDGLEILRRLVADQWASCHPELDPDDGNDPTVRINAVAGLSHREMINAVKSAPIVKSRAFGPVSFRDIEAGAVRQSDGTNGAASIDASFQDIPAAELMQAAASLARCVAEAKALDEAWATHLGDGAGPDMGDFQRALWQVHEAVRVRAAAAEAANAVPADEPGAPANGAGTGAGPLRGEPRSREDVIRAIDAICSYYSRFEPSSPVPLLLQRCKRLVTMSFLDIVKDMLPDGLSNIETIAGKPKE
jgi:type VI secretion system protein ImpA